MAVRIEDKQYSTCTKTKVFLTKQLFLKTENV